MRPVIILTIIGLLSAALLATMDDFTREPIAKAKEEMERKAIEQIFPFQIDSLATVPAEGTAFFEAYDAEGALRGLAVKCSTEKGYSGHIEVLLGVTPEHTIIDYKVLAHMETPGLGDKIDKPKFKQQFSGKTLEGYDWRVKKDGGWVDQLTAATISSRAITDAVHSGLELINKQYPNPAAK
ncbi:RnfABCDGE type electron transport complex subunit G [Chlorobium sp. N1]|uniref:RnfABCDGE type electron transport complex subunit G n=1 Tax=Chlorobium sp. N1 TaxID=2491138 RepID=UPI00103A468A|nr:RnfABCDGE type electron transport complex subunit G [Chlorobium sp. N1]TCD47484.1 RnfABCDGE type electron transport complex subunit G [Chlorobium sp. N1]